MASAGDVVSFSLTDVPVLADALTQTRLLVLAGASISKLGPSFFPDWFCLNRAILEDAKTSALRGLPSLEAKGHRQFIRTRWTVETSSRYIEIESRKAFEALRK